MDSLTQIVLGASVGELVLGKKVGNKAALWGAIGGTIPDLDVIARGFMETVDALHFHRGPTHSITFSILMAPILGLLISYIHRKSNATWKDWSWLMFWALFTHPILDCFTTWGTQLFWPFTDFAIAFQSVFVVDPIYTVPFMTLLIWALFLKREKALRRKLNMIGLIASTAYLGITVINKTQANNVFEASLVQKEISYSRYVSRPAPLQSILWTANVESEDGFYIAYYSFFDPDKNLNWTYHPKNYTALNGWEEHPKMKQLFHITKGWHSVSERGDTLVINDFRFGRNKAWGYGDQFVFSYEVLPKTPNGQMPSIYQAQARPENVGETMGQLWRRIWGDRSDEAIE